MKLTEKMAYLQGLMEGIEIDTSTKEGKILAKMSEVMNEIVIYVDDLQSQVDELSELCEEIDEDLGDLEREVYEIDDDDCDCGCDCDDCDCDCDDDEDCDCDCGCDDDEELYEVVCPECGETTVIGEDTLNSVTEIECPNCGTSLEFDLDDITIDDFEDDFLEGIDVKGIE